MSEAVEVKLKSICDDLHKILLDINLSLIDRVVQFDEEWALGSVRRDEINQLKEQSERAFAIHTPKIMRDDCRIIVFGETSAGKSTVINSLLKRDDLPNKNGRTTNCFVEIKLKDETFFTYQNQLEKDMSKLKEKTNFAAKSCLENGSRVQVFYSKEDCPFLQEGMTIIDIPGIDTDISIDNSIIEYCSTADIIILVVNSTQCIKGSVNKLINKSKTKFASLNVFFVFNHWDRLDGEIDKEAVKEQLMENARTFFKDRKNHPTSDMNDRIFFISGKEQMRLNKIKNDSISNEHQRIRNSNFIILEKKLQEEIKLMSHQRKYKYILELWDMIEENIKECETYFLNLKKEKASMLEKTKVILKKFDYSHGEIKGRIKSALVDIIEILLEKEKKNKLKTKVTNTKHGITNPFDEAPMLDIILQCLHSELGNNYKYLKRDIIKYFHQDTNMDAKHCILIIEKLYFREKLFSDFSFRKVLINDVTKNADQNTSSSNQGENNSNSDVNDNPNRNTFSSNEEVNNDTNNVTGYSSQNTSSLNQGMSNSKSNVTENSDQNTSSSNQGDNNSNSNINDNSDQNTSSSNQGENNSNSIVNDNQNTDPNTDQNTSSSNQGENNGNSNVTDNSDRNTLSSYEGVNNDTNIVTGYSNQNTSSSNQGVNNSNSNVTNNSDQNTSASNQGENSSYSNVYDNPYRNTLYSNEEVKNDTNNFAGHSDQNTLSSSQGVKSDQNSFKYDAFVSILEKNLKSYFGEPECFKKIEQDLTNDYLAFVEDIDKLLEKEFEKNFDNNDPTIKIREIRKDLEDVRRLIE